VARTAPVLCATVVLLGILTWPLLFTYSGFAGDWMHHLWLVWHQSRSIQHDGLPSLFLNSSYSVFNPIFAFYGGTLYAISGAIALVLGPVQAYVLVYVLDFAVAFAGWYWLGRMAGLGRWPAMVPGLIFVTSTYYVVIAYVQGDWPEFTGVSAIPLMVAASLSVLRADRLRLPAAIALTTSSVIFFGSHNITILLGLTTIAIAGMAVLVMVAPARRQLSPWALARVAAVVVPAALISSWYLLPATLYASRTRMGHAYYEARESLQTTASLVSLRNLTTFSRTIEPGIHAYDLQTALPVIAIAWVLLGALILPRRNRNRSWTLILLIFCGVAALVGLAMTHVGLLLDLPRPYTMIQFSYRLDIYVVLMLCAAVMAALVLARTASRRGRLWRWLAIPVCAVSLVSVIQQLRSFPYPGQDRYAALQSYGEVELGNTEDYEDASTPVIEGKPLADLYFAPATIPGSSASRSTSLRPGTLVKTNIAAGAYLLHVTGARPVGVDWENHDMVLEIGPRNGTGSGSRAASAKPRPAVEETTITVGTGESLPLVLGRWLTACGLAALVLVLVAVSVRGLLARRRAVDASQLDHEGQPADLDSLTVEALPRVGR
jgi:hypothetical protein